MDASDAAVFGVVVAGRLLLPLLIFRFPIVGILICLVLDGIDQTVFQQFTDLDLTGYQSYDKALDIYYLALAYIATMRNWVSSGALLVAQFLYFYRLVGVAIFEMTGAEHRVLLLLFPNTFEYFFIAYELVRSLWDPARRSTRFWVVTAAAIWVFVKLPQEYWIHVAQLDVTDTIRDYPAQSLLVIALLAAVVTSLAVYGWRRARPPDHALQLAAPPLPAEMDEAAERLAFRVARGRIFDLWLLEKVALISLVSIIFVQILPGADATLLQVSLAVGLLVVVNSGVYLVTARRGWGIESALWGFVALAVFNLLFVAITRWLQGRDPELEDSLFFILLLTLIVSTYDRYRPVAEARLGRYPHREPVG